MSDDHYYVAMDKVYKYLDTIDLSPYLKEYHNKEVYLLMDRLEEDHPYTDEYSHSLFDAIGKDEFIDYLRNNYNVGIYEETKTFLYNHEA